MHWHVLKLGAHVVDRTRRTFPGEPIPALDAIHLAVALVARSAAAGLDVLSLDPRSRDEQGLPRPAPVSAGTSGFTGSA